MSSVIQRRPVKRRSNNAGKLQRRLDAIAASRVKKRALNQRRSLEHEQRKNIGKLFEVMGARNE